MKHCLLSRQYTAQSTHACKTHTLGYTNTLKLHTPRTKILSELQCTKKLSELQCTILLLRDGTTSLSQKSIIHDIKKMGSGTGCGYAKEGRKTPYSTLHRSWLPNIGENGKRIGRILQRMCFCNGTLNDMLNTAFFLPARLLGMHLFLPVLQFVGEWNVCPTAHHCSTCPCGVHSPTSADRLHIQWQKWRLLSTTDMGNVTKGSGFQIPKCHTTTRKKVSADTLPAVCCGASILYHQPVVVSLGFGFPAWKYSSGWGGSCGSSNLPFTFPPVTPPIPG